MKFRKFILPFLLLAAGAVAILIYLRRRLAPPANHPRAFLDNGRATAGPVVVCAGDSLIQGVVSANFVSRLRERFGPQGLTFVNAGVNGDLSLNLLLRLDEIIACRSEAVIVLIGTNDVNATFSPETEKYYRRRKNLLIQPTPTWYRQNLEAIVRRLQAETRTHIALLSLPMIGELLTSEINQRIRAYNEEIREVAAGRGVTYLPLYETMVGHLENRETPPPLPYPGSNRSVLPAMVQHFLLGRSWDEIAAGNGSLLLTDHLHLSERGAAIVARLVGDYLETVFKAQDREPAAVG